MFGSLPTARPLLTRGDSRYSSRLTLGTRLPSVCGLNFIPVTGEHYLHDSLSLLYVGFISSYLFDQVQRGYGKFKGSASIEMREIASFHVKETSFTCSLVIHWIQ